MKHASSLPLPGALPQSPPARSAEDAVYRKITWRVMPIVLIAYVFAFLDRINIGYAQLQMKQDLAFSDAIYGLGAGIFFLTYLLFEVPSNLLLEKIGARLTFLRIMVLWGLTSAATAFVTEPWQFYGIRLLLGVFEAGFFPGIILYLTYWFPSHRRGRVTGLFLFGMPITGVLGGPLSGMIMSGMEGLGGWHGWQWMFIVEGLPTVLLGVPALSPAAQQARPGSLARRSREGARAGRDGRGPQGRCEVRPPRQAGGGAGRPEDLRAGLRLLLLRLRGLHGHLLAADDDQGPGHRVHRGDRLVSPPSPTSSARSACW